MLMVVVGGLENMLVVEDVSTDQAEVRMLV